MCFGLCSKGGKWLKNYGKNENADVQRMEDSTQNEKEWKIIQLLNGMEDCWYSNRTIAKAVWFNVSTLYSVLDSREIFPGALRQGTQKLQSSNDRNLEGLFHADGKPQGNYDEFGRPGGETTCQIERELKFWPDATE